MRTEVLARPFEAIGARLHIKIAEARPGQRLRQGRLLSATEDLTLDVTQDRLGEVFTLTIRSDVAGTLELQALDVQPKRRHLLLLAKRRDLADDKRKFLCGHDERHWFVMPVPEARGVTRVEQAMEALKPVVARIAYRRLGSRLKEWDARREAELILT